MVSRAPCHQTHNDSFERKKKSQIKRDNTQSDIVYHRGIAVVGLYLGSNEGRDFICGPV